MENHSSSKNDDADVVNQGLEGFKTNNDSSVDGGVDHEENLIHSNSNLITDGKAGREGEGEKESSSNSVQSDSRTPFSSLNQYEADLALARSLQEQERAYMRLRRNNWGNEHRSSGGSYFDEDDDFDDDDDDDDDESYVTYEENDEDNGVDVEVDPGLYSSDEALAYALHEAEERALSARLRALSGLRGRTEDLHNHRHDRQNAWEDVDPDELSYEELLALGEVIGTQSRGLSDDTIASLPSVIYKTGSSQNGNNDSCVICRIDYEDDETLTLLSCKHSYHSDCINPWLKINKTCPVCITEVSTPEQS